MTIEERIAELEQKVEKLTILAKWNNDRIQATTVIACSALATLKNISGEDATKLFIQTLSDFHTKEKSLDELAEIAKSYDPLKGEA